MIAILAALSLALAAEPLKIAGVEYEKLATRSQTEKRIYDLAFPLNATWGAWHVLAEFPFAGPNKNDLKTALPPETDLAKMTAGGPGPDLGATYDGRHAKATWKPLDYLGGRAIDLNPYCHKEIGKNSVVYLYCPITANADVSLPVTMGSDDGLRLWLNNRLLVDQDVARGLTPDEVKLTLELKKGVNHLLAKVTQGAGAFEFQINFRPQLDNYSDAMLAYQLDRDFPRSPEGEFYPLHTVFVPDDISLEVGGLGVLPDGRPIVCTRRGEVFIVSNASEEIPTRCTFTRFASGLHEPLGLSVREGLGKNNWCIDVVQRGELTRLADTTGDDVADTYDTISDAWGVSGNYHEFAFGGVTDRDGSTWVTLNVGFCGSLGKSLVPYRGWAVKITKDGNFVPVCDGLRSPNGVGMFSDGTMFYLDNQGDYVGTCRMSPLIPGSYAGHPAGLRWRRDWSPGSPAPEVTPATIWFPYRKMGQSAADFLLCDPKNPAHQFAMYQGQVFVGDQTMCTVMRCSIEKVEGVYQGACYPFREGLQCGVNRLAWGTDGSLFAGQTDRGWGSIGRRRFGLERITLAKTPFELLEMRAQPDGFELRFTQDIDPASITPASFSMSSHTYLYHATYGSPEVQTQTPTITAATPTNPRTVRLKVDGLREKGMGFVHELAMPGVRSSANAPLLHDKASYTLQRLPKSER